MTAPRNPREIAPLPAFDCHCPLLSLPRVFKTNLATIPNTVPAAARACSQGNRGLIANHTAWPAARTSHGIAALIAHTTGALRLGGLAGSTSFIPTPTKLPLTQAGSG